MKFRGLYYRTEVELGHDTYGADCKVVSGKNITISNIRIHTTTYIPNIYLDIGQRIPQIQ